MIEEQMVLTEWQEELLKETFNIGVGNASAAFSELAGCEIILTVPDISTCKLENLIESISNKQGEKLSATVVQYSGPFEGTAMLLYSEESSLEIIKLIAEGLTVDIDDIKEDALIEVGNLVLNRCLSGIANLLDTEIHSQIPTLISGSTRNVISLKNSFNTQKNVIFLQMGFDLEEHNIKINLSSIWDGDKINRLLNFLDEYQTRYCA